LCNRVWGACCPKDLPNLVKSLSSPKSAGLKTVRNPLCAVQSSKGRPPPCGKPRVEVCVKRGKLRGSCPQGVPRGLKRELIVKN